MDSLKNLYAQACPQESKDVIRKLWCKVEAQEQRIAWLTSALAEEIAKRELNDIDADTTGS